MKAHVVCGGDTENVHMMRDVAVGRERVVGRSGAELCAGYGCWDCVGEL